MPHTPGPWRTGPINYADVYGPDGQIVALCPKPSDTAEDDARLITAAPDLLAALRRVISWEEHTNWLEPIPVDIADDIRAAIAKAEE